jgi:hypothetical protein
MKTFKTKKEAIQEAKKRRANGETVKVFCHTGVGAQPGKGLAAYRYYTVKAL